MSWLALLMAVTPCTPPGPDAPVPVSFTAGATLDDLEAFAARVLCRPKGQGGARPLTLTVEGTVFGRQIPALIRLLAESAGGAPSAVEPTAAPCPPLPAGAITPVDPWTRKVAASAREALIACSESHLRLVPSFVQGKPEGFKVFGIRQGGVVDLLGVKNGDVVTAVNGQSLATAEQALAAAALLKTAAEVKLTVRREGEPRTITWTIK